MHSLNLVVLAGGKDVSMVVVSAEGGEDIQVVVLAGCEDIQRGEDIQGGEDIQVVVLAGEVRIFRW